MHIFQIVGIWTILIVNIFGEWSEYEIERVTPLESEEGVFVDFHLRAKRCNKTHYTITGTVDINPEENDMYDISIELFSRPDENSQYSRLPYEIPRKPSCEFINVDYRKFFMEELQGLSDFPSSDDAQEDLCEKFEKKTYEIKNYFFNKEIIPTAFDIGSYKGVVTVYRGVNVVGGVEVYIMLK